MQLRRLMAAFRTGICERRDLPDVSIPGSPLPSPTGLLGRGRWERRGGGDAAAQTAGTGHQRAGDLRIREAGHEAGERVCTSETPPPTPRAQHAREARAASLTSAARPAPASTSRPRAALDPPRERRLRPRPRAPAGLGPAPARHPKPRPRAPAVLGPAPGPQLS